MRLDRLFPEWHGSWLIWLIGLCIVFPLYYLVWPYPQIATYVENNRWEECEWGKQCGLFGNDSEGNLRIHIRAPKYIAHFAEMPLEVRAVNTSTMPVIAIVTVKVEPPSSEQRVYIRLVTGGVGTLMGPSEETPGEMQNSVNFQEIPPQGEKTASFMVRVVGNARIDDRYKITLKVNGEDVLLGRDYSTHFNPPQVLKLTLSRYLLLPPGSNIFIPTVLLLYIGYVEFWLKAQKVKALVLFSVIFSLIMPAVIYVIYKDRHILWAVFALLFFLTITPFVLVLRRRGMLKIQQSIQKSREESPQQEDQTQ